MPRGGKRPGAGAPKGNTNALRYGRYSRQYPDAAMLVAIIPELRHELDLAYKQSSVIANRRLRQMVDAAQQVIETTPDFAERIEVAIFVRRQRLPHVDRGPLFFDATVMKAKTDRLRNAFRMAGWLIKRDAVFARVLTGIMLPPIRSALVALEQPKKPGRNSIKQSSSSQNESEQAHAID